LEGSTTQSMKQVWKRKETVKRGENRSGTEQAVSRGERFVLFAIKKMITPKREVRSNEYWQEKKQKKKAKRVEKGQTKKELKGGEGQGGGLG